MCIGLSKLLLCGLITDTKVLTTLVLTYISPSTRENTELKQCLSYFFPVYCYSSPANQDRMRRVGACLLPSASSDAKDTDIRKCLRPCRRFA